MTTSDPVTGPQVWSSLNKSWKRHVEIDLWFNTKFNLNPINISIILLSIQADRLTLQLQKHKLEAGEGSVLAKELP